MTGSRRPGCRKSERNAAMIVGLIRAGCMCTVYQWWVCNKFSVIDMKKIVR